MASLLRLKTTENDKEESKILHTDPCLDKKDNNIVIP
jgi:hypothetical protein